jgi:hypothetical protein
LYSASGSIAWGKTNVGTFQVACDAAKLHDPDGVRISTRRDYLERLPRFELAFRRETAYPVVMDKLIQIELSRSERDLLLAIKGLNPEVERKLKVATMQGNTFRVKYTDVILNGLIDGLKAECDKTGDATLAKACGDLRGKIERTLKAST